MSKHGSRKDRLLLAVAVIAGFALYDIWGAWTEVGNKSGFAHGTGWTLTVIVEVYGACALWAWLADAPGPRSRRFAKWSAVLVLVLSFAGQASSHLTAGKQVPPGAVVVFVSVLPVVVLALIALLVHYRIADRAAAAEAAGQAAEARETEALRAALTAAEQAVAAAQDERDEAQRCAAETTAAASAAAQAATAEAEVMARKLAAAQTAVAAARKDRKSPQKRATETAAKVPQDVDAQAAALAIIAAEPDITGKDLGARVGRSERWGQDFKKNLTPSPAGPEGPAAAGEGER